MDIPNISPTSTKAEILEAYNKLKSLLDNQSATKDLPFRARVITELENIENTLTEKTAEITEFDKQIIQLKARLDLGKRIAFTQETLQNLQDKINQEERNWERQKRQLAEELKDEADFAKKRVTKEIEDKKWAYEMEAKQKRRELEDEDKQFRKKYTDYQMLQNQVASFPEKIEQEITNEVVATEKRLMVQFDQGEKIAKQEYTSQIKLLEQRIETLVNRGKEYQNEIQALQKQLAESSQQLKQIAVAALQREPNSSQSGVK